MAEKRRPKKNASTLSVRASRAERSGSTAAREGTCPRNRQARSTSTAATATETKSRKTKTEDEELCPIVGIGGSAGGFEAAMELLRHLPAKTSAAIIETRQEQTGSGIPRENH